MVKERLYWWRVEFGQSGDVICAFKAAPSPTRQVRVEYVRARDRDGAIRAAQNACNEQRRERYRANELCRCGRPTRQGRRQCDTCNRRSTEYKNRRKGKDAPLKPLPGQRWKERKAEKEREELASSVAMAYEERLATLREVLMQIECCPKEQHTDWFLGFEKWLRKQISRITPS